MAYLYSALDILDKKEIDNHTNKIVYSNSINELMKIRDELIKIESRRYLNEDGNSKKVLKRIKDLKSDIKFKYNHLDKNENSINENPNIETSSNEVVKDEVKKELHNHIFKDNAFLIFENYYQEYQLNQSSRADLRVLYEMFKLDKLFVETVELKHYIDWLFKNEYYCDPKELKTIVLTTKNNIVKSTNYKRIKTSLESTLK
jgi:hypothetical protein